MQTRLKNRKEQIVELALELIQSHGFENFSYQDLAKQLGITKASIHHHFPKKADLGIAICNAIQAWHQREFGKIQFSDCTAMEKLERYTNGVLRYACGKNKVCPLSSLQADITSLPAAMAPELKKLDEYELTFIAEILKQGRESGEFTFTGSTESQAVIVVLAYKGALQYSRVHGAQIFEQTMNQMIALLTGKSLDDLTMRSA